MYKYNEHVNLSHNDKKSLSSPYSYSTLYRNTVRGPHHPVVWVQNVTHFSCLHKEFVWSANIYSYITYIHIYKAMTQFYYFVYTKPRLLPLMVNKSSCGGGSHNTCASAYIPNTYNSLRAWPKWLRDPSAFNILTRHHHHPHVHIFATVFSRLTRHIPLLICIPLGSYTK